MRRTKVVEITCDTCGKIIPSDQECISLAKNRNYPTKDTCMSCVRDMVIHWYNHHLLRKDCSTCKGKGDVYNSGGMTDGHNGNLINDRKPCKACNPCFNPNIEY